MGCAICHLTNFLQKHGETAAFKARAQPLPWAGQTVPGASRQEDWRQAALPQKLVAGVTPRLQTQATSAAWHLPEPGSLIHQKSLVFGSSGWKYVVGRHSH